MANRKKLKGLRKNRQSLSAGKRRRSKQKKTVREKRRLRLRAEKLEKVVALPTFPDITVIE